jgi:CHAT domain-containing protein
MQLLIYTLKVRYLLFSYLTFFIIISYPQEISSQHDTIKANNWLEKVEKSGTDLNTEQKIKLINDAAQIFKANHKYRRMYNCVFALYMIGRVQNDYKIVLPHIMKISSEIKNKKDKADADFVIAWIFEAIGDVHFSLTKYKVILKPYIELNDTLKLAGSYNNLGNIYNRLRDYHNAIRYLEKAIDLKSFLNDAADLSKSVYNLGLAHLYNNNPEKARSYIIRANELKKRPLGDFEIRMAETYLMSKDYDKANELANKAVNLYYKTNKKDDPYYLKILGDITQAQNKYEEAEAIYEKALKYKKEILDRREIVKILLPLATAQLALNKTDEALKNIDEAIEMVKPSKIKKSDLQILDKNWEPKNDMYYIDLHAAKAQCMINKYKQNKQFFYLQQADNLFTRCFTFIDDMKMFYEESSAKIDLNKDAKPIFSQCIDNKIKMFEVTKDNKYIEEAFIVAQKFNSFSLREQISEKTALDVAITDPIKKETYTQLKTAYLNASFKLNGDFTSEAFKEYEDHKNKFYDFEQSLQKEYPKFKKIKAQIETISSTQIQEILKRDEVFINYYIGLENIYGFYITKSKFSYFLVKNDLQFSQSLQKYLNILSGKATIDQLTAKEFSENAHLLYKRLIAPDISSLMDVRKMIIVPDGPLFRIPFEALMTNNGSWQKKENFLISKYDIKYLYYCQQLKMPKPKVHVNDFLGIGLEYDKYTLESMKDLKKDTIPDWIHEKFRSESLSHLYFADDEIEALTRFFRGKTFINEKALKFNVINHVHNKNIIHISAHSCVDFQYPENSAIILQKNLQNPDNILSYKDILAMNLNCQMVTLSSCNSASGKILDGESVASLSKAFFESGSRSVVGSYWSVPDEMSKLFMESFYSKLSDGLSKDEALRAVKLEIMDMDNTMVNPAYKIPPYWAAWVVYGDTDPIETGFGKYWIWVLLIAVSLIIFVVYFIRKNRRTA